VDAPAASRTLGVRDERPPLFTREFFTMCAFTFLVFFSMFILLPTIPFRVIDEGGSEALAGTFLGLLTYSSALSALFTGALSDHVGRRRQLLVCSIAVALLSLSYGFASVTARLFLVVLHGIFWSGLLLAQSSFMQNVMPPARRGEGLAYWGMATLLAVSIAPRAGFWLYEMGWIPLTLTVALLNVVMAAISWSLREDAHDNDWPTLAELMSSLNFRVWRLSLALMMYSFAYGGLMSFSALLAVERNVEPKEIFLTAMAFTNFLSRPVSARFVDRIGHAKVFRACVALIPVGLLILVFAHTKMQMLVSAVIFGLAYGNAHPAFTAYVIENVDARARGGALGGILAAFDLGIGTGSVVTGFLVHRASFEVAFVIAALLSALSLPYFNWARRRFEATGVPVGVNTPVVVSP
jgi:MFS family permease